MGKFLTISIAAYNVEQYIRKTLDSLIDERIIDDLEIFVVDDGGTDGTLAIAQEYANRYPQSIFPIHKENGGYGSTINYSIAHATGKYFKLLDGDDWFEKGNLWNFIQSLRVIDTDIVITPFFKYCGEQVEKKGIDTTYILDTDLPISNMTGDHVFGMWAITYKLEVLKKSGLNLPLHCLYTDRIYSIIPFSVAKSIRFMNCGVYCYRIGHEDQSVSKTSRIKHMEESLRVIDILSEFFKQQKSMKNENLQYILHRVTSYSQSVVKTYLLKPVSKEIIKQIAQYDYKLKLNTPDIYRMWGNVFICKKFAVYMNMLRLCRYGKLGLLISKLILPKDGLPSWG